MNFELQVRNWARNNITPGNFVSTITVIRGLEGLTEKTGWKLSSALTTYARSGRCEFCKRGDPEPGTGRNLGKTIRRWLWGYPNSETPPVGMPEPARRLSERVEELERRVAALEGKS